MLAGEEQEAVQFGGPTLRVLAARRVRRDPQLARLGPDLLAADFDSEQAIAAIRADPARGLGDALLDQTLVAGIGNIFKSEACFAARIDPWRSIGDLSDQELGFGLQAAREQMLEPLPATVATASPVSPQRRPLSSLRGPISSRGQGDANRTTYWCPGCQR